MHAASTVVSPNSDRRRAILAAARKAFLRHGYEATLEIIAEGAGVARRTIFYNFGTKERLFREIIDEMSVEAMPQLALDRAQPMPAALLHFARTYVSLTVSPETIAIQRMLLSGAPNLLEHMRSVVETNYERLVAELSRYFKERIVAREMRAVNTEHAAERFLASILGGSRIQMMFGAEPNGDDRDTYITEAVVGFIYGVRPSAR